MPYCDNPDCDGFVSHRYKRIMSNPETGLLEGCPNCTERDYWDTFIPAKY